MVVVVGGIVVVVGGGVGVVVGGGVGVVVGGGVGVVVGVGVGVVVGGDGGGGGVCVGGVHVVSGSGDGGTDASAASSNGTHSLSSSSLLCSDLIDIRERYFTARTLRTLFRDVPLDCLFGYLRETNIIYLCKIVIL